MKRILPLTALTVALACAGAAPPADVFHRLPLVTPSARPAPLLPGVVEVDRLDASDALRGRAMMIARDGNRPGRLERSSYQFWVDAPPRLLQEGLVAHLRALGAAQRVVVPERRDEPDWVVSGRIERFERVLGAGGGRVEVALELFARETTPPRRGIQSVQAVSEPVGGDAATAAVEAFGRAVTRAFDGFVADLEAGLR